MTCLTDPATFPAEGWPASACRLLKTLVFGRDRQSVLAAPPINMTHHHPHLDHHPPVSVPPHHSVVSAPLAAPHFPPHPSTKKPRVA
ncbi:hypothetical protein E2C01_053002 [Portunus trituberculatus]|uniref:Uncharacterized protein n=1 Tax=Portunus trituberculatus TaxID=210409 RepID=A0A5B7GNY7_PORTR|nr:hypothetical protein [Portunus trituberculatus]